MNIHSGWTLHPRFSVQLIVPALGAVFALMISLSAVASDETPEVKVAAVHAGLAAASDDIGGVHMHLHHTMNCLVGPDGAAFSAEEMNPCEGMGNGAIPGTDDKHNKERLEKAAGWVKRGINSDSYEDAQDAANNALQLLKAQEL